MVHPAAARHTTMTRHMHPTAARRTTVMRHGAPRRSTPYDDNAAHAPHRSTTHDDTARCTHTTPPHIRRPHTTHRTMLLHATPRPAAHRAPCHAPPHIVCTVPPPTM